MIRMKTVMMKRSKLYSIAMVFLICLLCAVPVLAETLPCRTAEASGFYRNPETGVVEDSGGEEQEALGQSMVTNVVDTTALVETKATDGYYLSLRLHLMNSISEVSFYVQEPGETEWKEVEKEQTANADDQADFRLSIDSEETIVRAECYVEPMGRSVIFFITLHDFVEGNEGGFVQMDETETEKAKDTEEVTGLTIGGNITTQNVEESKAVEEDVTSLTIKEGEKVEMQQLNLSSGVWCMLLLIVLCGTILANLLMMGVKILLKKYIGKQSDSLNENRDMNTEHLEYLDDLDSAEIDWEAQDENQQ